MEQGVLDEEVALEEDVQLKYASTGHKQDNAGEKGRC